MNKKFLLWGALIALALFIFSGVNTIPTLDEEVKASWSQVENQYQRRMDLIPNLVKTVKGYAAHESSTLEAVISARANATKVTITPETVNDPEALKKYEQAQGALSSALSRLLMVSENYPNLKADQQFLALQSQLEGTENRISIARKDYIEVMRRYNTTVRTFPGLIWAKIYGVSAKPVFTASTGAEKAPEVNF
jgi:LemA protein